MAQLGTVFNANEVEPSQRNFSPMTPGKRLVQIVASGMRKVKPKGDQDPNGDYGEYLSLELEVMDGPDARRKHWENLNLNHSDPQTVEISRQRLREICMAVGKPNISDSEELHFIPMVADFYVHKDKKGIWPDSNRVRAFLSYDGQAPQQPARMPAAAMAGAGGGAGGGWGAATGGGAPSAAMTAVNRPAAAPGAMPWHK
jgi:hypothetical protein